MCGDERANDGVPFFYFYQVVFKSIGVRLPSVDIFLGCAPSVGIFLHFFEVKRQRNNL